MGCQVKSGAQRNEGNLELVQPGCLYFQEVASVWFNSNIVGFDLLLTPYCDNSFTTSRGSSKPDPYLAYSVNVPEQVGDTPGSACGAFFPRWGVCSTA